VHANHERFHLSDNSDSIDHNLYAVALEIYANDKTCLRVVQEAYGDYLSSKGSFAEAGLCTRLLFISLTRKCS
jgi:hypothetical protein